MPSNIVGYEWPLNQTAHVAYESGDEHMHEMVAGTDGKWRDNDITRNAGGPELEDAILAGYTWPAGNTQQIAYVGPMDSNRHIYELVMLADHPWSIADIMEQTKAAPVADGEALVGYGWRTGGTKQIVYTSLDGHVHELSAGEVGAWRYVGLTQFLNAPISAGSVLAAFPWEGNTSKQVVYMSSDGHIHELMMKDAIWTHLDLTHLVDAPLADGAALAACAWEAGGTQQIVYTGNDGNIYELVAGSDGAWRSTDLTDLTSSPLVSGSALATFAMETIGGIEVVYVGTDHHVHELMMDGPGAWQHTDLTHLTGASDAGDDTIVGYEWSAQFAKHVVYIDTRENPHIHSLLFKQGGRWQHTDLTDLTGAQSLV